MNVSADDPLLTVAECAQRLGIFGVKSMTFVRDEILAGRLPAIIRHRESGRRWYRVKESDLDAYIERHWRYTGQHGKRA